MHSRSDDTDFVTKKTNEPFRICTWCSVIEWLHNAKQLIVIRQFLELVLNNVLEHFRKKFFWRKKNIAVHSQWHKCWRNPMAKSYTKWPNIIHFFCLHYCYEIIICGNRNRSTSGKVVESERSNSLNETLAV